MPSDPYLRRLLDGERPRGNTTTEHYWRWPIGFHFRRVLGVSLHGVRDGTARGRGIFQPAVRSFLWIGPIGIEFGWHRQAIEDWRWRRSLRKGEGR